MFPSLSLLLGREYEYMYMYLQPSVCTLYPPHYDAVSSFGVHGDLLFSSCGVTIKQWDMRERSLKQVSECVCMGVCCKCFLV